MSETLKFGNGQWATKVGSTLAYNDENGNFKPLPFNFTRSTSATRVNKDGLIEVVTNNKPRIDFLNNSNGALLLEPARTNLLIHSRLLSNWTNIQNVTVTDNNIISPDGTQSASKINETATTSLHRLFLNPTTTSEKHTYSVYLKAGTRNWAFLRLDGVLTEQRTWFNLENGSIGTISADHIATIEDVGNGWYRCSVSIKGTTYDTTPLAIIGLATANNVIEYAGDINRYIYAWGAQLEAGSYATSYIPTQGAAATRVAETCNISNLDDYVASQDAWTAAGEFVKGQDKDNSLYILFAYYLGTTNLFRIRDFSTSIRFYLFEPTEESYAISFNLGQSVKWSIRAKSDGTYTLYVNGNLIVERSGTFRKLDAYNLIGNAKVSLNNLKIYNEALTNQELINLTTI